MHIHRFGPLLLLLSLIALAACGSADVPSRALTDDDLRTAALRVDDLPPGFTARDERPLTNQDVADLTTQPETVRGLLDDSGRDGGFESSFAAGGPLDRPGQPSVVVGLFDRYGDAARARSAFAHASDLDQYAKQPITGQKPFDAPRLGDQSGALRGLITDASGTDFVVYAITFREGAVIASVTTLAVKHKDDRGQHAARLARLLDERLSNRLSTP